MNPEHVLAPLAARYADWLALPDSAVPSTVDAADGDAVWAMPVILRIERAQPPARTALLEAAAAAAVAVCLDPRAQPGEPWHAPLVHWTARNIRKVARRARGAHWSAVQDLDGVTVTVGGASARALLPGPVDGLPKEVSRLQISGSELPADAPSAPDPGLPVLWLDPAVTMTAGKAAAQVGHGAMLLATLLAASDAEAELAGWAEAGFRCAVRTAAPRTWAALAPAGAPWAAWRDRRVVAVRDAGFTEVAPGTVTVVAQWPEKFAPALGSDADAADSGRQ
ncbi:MAG TPA: peptidyl-tRNA hydrolase [Pseudonocardiaceae bacterium]|nr:peptidyl-tRNA hydrolase [Pseudonocardiaceae bacterium]